MGMALLTLNSNRGTNDATTCPDVGGVQLEGFPDNQVWHRYIQCAAGLGS